MRRLLLLWMVLVLPARGSAQGLTLEPRSLPFWLGAGALVLGASSVDHRVRSYSLDHRSGTLRSFADVGEHLGRGSYAFAGLGIAYVGARLADRRDLSDKIKFAALGYTAATVLVGVVKVSTGRHRPDDTDDASRFRPFHTGDDWSSLPSAHVVHAFSLAAALDAQTKSRWLAAAGYGAATLVAWSRVYDDKHWSSDVVIGATLGVATTLTVVRWLERIDRQ